MYEKINIDLMNNANVNIIDLRSDTFSKPTPEMREAMASAEVGDACYGEDPTVNELEKRAAELVGKEDALYVCSGTMSNLIAIMVHCNQRGSEMICGDRSHTYKFEQGGAAQIAGVLTCLIKNKDDGTFSLDELRDKIRKSRDFHETITSLIVVENTHNLCGGNVLPLDFLEKVFSIAREHDVPVHMDGARMMNAAVFLNVPPKRIVRDVDTVSFCLSKGLGAPIGSILAGNAQFIEQARRVSKVLGGCWRQAGIIASAGIVAIDKMIDRLQIDHEHTYKLAKAIHNAKSSIFKVNLPTVQTNILLMYVDKSKVEIRELQRRLQSVQKTDSVKCSVRCTSLSSNCVRFVLYWEITDKDVEMACEKILLVIREYEEKFK